MPPTIIYLLVKILLVSTGPGILYIMYYYGSRTSSPAPSEFIKERKAKLKQLQQKKK